MNETEEKNGVAGDAHMILSVPAFERKGQV